MLDISKHINICESVIGFVSAIANAPFLTVSLNQFPYFAERNKTNSSLKNELLSGRNEIDVFMMLIGYESENTARDLLIQLLKLQKHVEIYLSKLKKVQTSSTQHNLSENFQLYIFNFVFFLIF